MDKYAFQDAAEVDALHFLRTAGRGESLMLHGPTGCGKGVIEARVHFRMQEPGRLHYTVAPTIEILSGIYDKLCGTTIREFPREELEARGFWTVKTLLNRLRDGSVKLPDTLTFDEAHHSVDDTHTELWSHTGLIPRLGLTATDYRGTPAETAKLRTAWPNRRPLITLADAVRTGVISQPTFAVWPLLNDDEIDVVNGEFVVSQVESQFRTVLDDLVARICAFWGEKWDRPTSVVVNSVVQAQELCEAINRHIGAEVSRAVLGGTTNREAIFADVVACKTLLISVAVLGEGVDLPLRRCIDCGPTMSPVRFMQGRTGRITRPTDSPPPEYIACCHNLTRHAYLWQGLIPPSEIRAAQQAWGEEYKPPRRSLARAIGIEGFGKFTVSPVRLVDGTTGSLYSLQTRDGLEQYAVFLHPSIPDPLYVQRKNALTGATKQTADGYSYAEKKFGKWKRVEAFPELIGCLSTKPSKPSPGMLAWWEKDAERYGLDANTQPDARTFQMLPILANINGRLCQNE